MQLRQEKDGLIKYGQYNEGQIRKSANQHMNNRKEKKMLKLFAKIVQRNTKI